MCKSLTIQVQDYPLSDINEGIVITTTGHDVYDLEDTATTVDAVVGSGIDVDPDTLLQTVVPPEALTLPTEQVSAALNGTVRLTYLVYATDALFPSPYIMMISEESAEYNRTVNSLIVSVTVGGKKIENLSQTINMTFLALVVRDYHYFKICSYSNINIFLIPFR